MEIRNFEIMFSDLNDNAQIQLLKAFNTSLDLENWETISIAIIERE